MAHMVFQVVPLFFLVAGYANAVSWTRWRVSDRAASWYRHRLAAVLGPTTVYVAVVLAAAAVLVRAGVGPQLALVAWAVALHLWFVPVYLLVVALTPVAVAAQQRWGLAVPAALALAVVIVDIAVHCADLTPTAG